MEDEKPVTEVTDELLPADTGAIPEDDLLPASVGDVQTEGEAPKQCPKCGIPTEGNIELRKGKPRRQPWGGKLVKLAPVMLTCMRCGHGYELVGLEKGKSANRPRANAESVKKNRRKAARISRKANGHQRKGQGKRK